MNTETFARASGIIDQIDDLKGWRERVVADELFKKNYTPPKHVLESARVAMLAVIDEKINALEEELAKL